MCKNYSPFPFCISRLSDAGTRRGTHRSAEWGNDEDTLWARHRAALEGCVERGKQGEERGSRKESQEDDENTVTELPLCWAHEPHYLTASSQLHDTGSTTVPTLPMRKLSLGEER